MVPDSLLTTTLVVIGLILLVLFVGVRLGLRAPVLYVCVMYLYLSCGPVVNHLLGNNIYFGIREEYIPSALLIFALGQVGLVAGGLVIGVRRSFNMNSYSRTPLILYWVLAGLTAISVVLLIRVAPFVFHYSKSDKIGLVPFHYSYLLVQMFALATYFSARNYPRIRGMYFANIILYVAYSIVMGERDFLFIVASILILRLMVGELRLGLRFISYMLIGLAAGTYLYNFRGSGTSSGVEAVLNQGSLLFINTNILYLFPDHLPFEDGGTYWNAAMGILPTSDRANLVAWFKGWYAPGSTSGYGFALDAEAYMNFGYIGVLTVFFGLGGVLMWLANRIDRGPVYSGLAVFFLAQLMYSLRNDSWVLVHTTVYAAVFFIATHTVIVSQGAESRPVREDVHLPGDAPQQASRRSLWGIPMPTIRY